MTPVGSTPATAGGTPPVPPREAPAGAPAVAPPNAPGYDGPPKGAEPPPDVGLGQLVDVRV